MIIYQNSPKHGELLKVVALFGNGLIGSTVSNNLHSQPEYSSKYVPFEWGNFPACVQQSGRIFQYISDSLKTSADSSVAFVWCAGKAGFSATSSEMEEELYTYDIVLNLVRKISGAFPESKTFFHQLSSAGGLFENQCMIDLNSVPHPLRFYGRLKFKQETMLREVLSASQTRIYRPTSVYGYTGKGSRMGLIPTLLKNGFQNKTSTIVGDLSTLRDYIFNENIGRYIFKWLFRDLESGQSNIFLLASGKPSSISEIKYFVEQAIGKKIYLKFQITEETVNKSDITVNSSALPPEWAPTDIKSGIRIIKEKIISNM